MLEGPLSSELAFTLVTFRASPHTSRQKARAMSRSWAARL